MLLIFLPNLQMGGSPSAVVVPAVPSIYEKEILSMQLCGDLSMTMGLRKAHSAMVDDLESLAFFMGGG